VEIALLLDFGDNHLVGEFVAVAHVPFCEEVVLDPKHFVDGFDDGDFAVEFEAGMGEDRFRHDVLDEAEGGTDVDVFDVEGMFAALADVHHSGSVLVSICRAIAIYCIFLLVRRPSCSIKPQECCLPDLVQVLPELHLTRITAELLQISSQEQLPIHYLRAVLVRDLYDGALVRRRAGRESLSRDVILQQLLVDDVDDGGNERFDVLGADDQGLNVGCGVKELAA
jgi:hypothetical protein